MADIIENALENTLLANSSGVDVFADESEEDKVSSPLHAVSLIRNLFISFRVRIS